MELAPIELAAVFALGVFLIWVAWIRDTSDAIEGSGEEHWRFRRR